MHNGCVKSVPQPDSRFETFARPVADWHARLTAGLSRSVQASDQNLGHLEEEILHATRDLERKILEEAAQQKADHSPPVCPVCGHKLSACTRDHARTFQSRFGPVTVKRRRGWYRRCQAWCFPADHALGLSETGGASPSVQEMAALTVSKMPVNEASAVLERLTGVKLPPATLDREARRHGRRAHKKRAQRDEPMRAAAGPSHKSQSSIGGTAGESCGRSTPCAQYSLNNPLDGRSVHLCTSRTGLIALSQIISHKRRVSSEAWP